MLSGREKMSALVKDCLQKGWIAEILQRSRSGSISLGHVILCIVTSKKTILEYLHMPYIIH